jgi:hypothetical protein
VERTGRGATDVIRRFRPALVLCDLGSRPGRLRHRRGHPLDHELAALPLIAISGYGATEDQVRSRPGAASTCTSPSRSPRLLLSGSRAASATPAVVRAGVLSRVRAPPSRRGPRGQPRPWSDRRRHPARRG